MSIHVVIVGPKTSKKERLEIILKKLWRPL